MSKHLENEVLKEQRKSREEFLKLKKMQHGELDAGPKPSEVAIVPKTPWEKIKNIWFHNGKVILVSVFFIAVGIFLVAQCMNKPKYDIQVVYYTYTYALDENVKGMEEYFNKYAKDLNGDGEVNVNVINCSYTKSDTLLNIKSTYETRLQATVTAEANALLYITDAESYKHFTDVFGDNFFDGEPLLLSEEFYKSASIKEYDGLPEGLTISLRKTTDTMLEMDKNTEKYLKESSRILKEIVENK